MTAATTAETDKALEVFIPVGSVALGGELIVTAKATGVVLFAHGSGSSRHSPRNQFVARVIRDAGVGTLLFDLLNDEEEAVDSFTGHLRFDVPFLARRLLAATEWFKKIFSDRTDAGQFLAEKLTEYANRRDVLVLALPRGGVPVAYEVATRLNAPLDVFVVRKLGVPGHEELAMGAIASGGVRVLNPDVLAYLLIHEAIIDQVTEFELSELTRRERLYRGNRPPLEVRGKTVIIVDDGLATGSTMRAAVKALRQKQPKKIVVAVPVGARETCDSFRNDVDTMAVCAITPEPFQAVGLWYQDFSQTTDEEVRELLALADEKKAAA